MASRYVLVKDHTLEGPFALATLRFMDRVANPTHVVEMPSNYWPEERWRREIAGLGLRIDVWRDTVPLFPIPLDWVFGRRLHFLARLARD